MSAGVGLASIHRIRAAVRNIQSTQLTSILSSNGAREIDSRQIFTLAAVTTAGQLKRQIMTTCGVVFVFFDPHSVHESSESNATPHSRCDDTVVSEFGLMFVWLLNSPEFVSV
jgi:hypothetical protein